MNRCPSYPGYSVNTNNEAFSHRKRRRIPNLHGGTEAYIDYKHIKKLRHFVNKKGYLEFGIKTDKGIRAVGIHVLVADAYIGKKPIGMVVRHKDNNKKNNHPNNLCYGTHQDNATDRVVSGGYAQGENHSRSRFTKKQVLTILKLRKQRIKTRVIAQKFSTCTAVIEGIIYNKTYLNIKRDKVMVYRVKDRGGILSAKKDTAESLLKRPNKTQKVNK
ncbi:MAG: HNH endonuclease [Bacteroidota bacterium]